MGLWYYLKKNLLTKDEDDCIAQTTGSRVYNDEEVIDEILVDPTVLSKTDLLAAINAYIEAIAKITANGDTVNTRFIKTGFYISGVFENLRDTYRKDTHKVTLNILPGRILVAALAKVQAQRTSHPDNKPLILDVRDHISGSLNKNITSKGTVSVYGEILKVDGEDASVGAYLVNTEGEALKISNFVDNTPSRLIVILPELPAGDYILKITTQSIDSHLVKEPRTGTFDKILTVL